MLVVSRLAAPAIHHFFLQRKNTLPSFQRSTGVSFDQERGRLLACHSVVLVLYALLEGGQEIWACLPQKDDIVLSLHHPSLRR